MNIDPNVIRVLCYGDSNTYGADPKTDERYPADVRWTGVLQDLLGNDYEIIEEGAEKYNTGFVNLQELVKPSSEDGVHLDPESHKIIAEALVKEIKL